MLSSGGTMRSSLKAVPLAFGVLMATPAIPHAADLVIGVPSWSSALVTAHVLKAAIEGRFDVTVGIDDGTNEEIFAAMDAGTAHIHPEVWLPNHTALTSEFVVRRKTVEMSPRGVPARQGICVTRQTQEELGIASVADLADPETAKAFDTNGDGMGEIWIGAPDWTSTRIERIRAKSYGYAETMELLEAEETMATAAIDAAIAVGKPLVFYCYEPHHVFELHDIVHLTEPPHDPRRWTIVDAAADPDWLNKSDAGVAWPVSFFHIFYSMKLAEERPEIAAFLEAVELDVDTVSQMTYAVVVERQDPVEFATRWLNENEARVADWTDERK